MTDIHVCPSWAHCIECNPEPTREELIAALTCAESILWMAEKYAEAGGSRSIEMEEYNDASETIRAVLARCRKGE